MTSGETDGSLERQVEKAGNLIYYSRNSQATSQGTEEYTQGSLRGREDEEPNRTDTQTSTRTEDGPKRCSCGRSFKNQRGLNIHRGKMKCTAATGTQLRLIDLRGVGQEGTQEVPRTERSGQTQENHSQEADHSAEILEVPQETIQATPQRAEQVARPPQHMEDPGS